MRCEDYPCCGHTPEDPCDRQWYDEPDAFDLTRNPHALCDHEEGFCDVYDDEEGEDYALSGSYNDAPEYEDLYASDEDLSDFADYMNNEDDFDPMEDQWLDGSYEE